ncbi:OmpA family protein [Novosphingobium sp. Leaf2]|uniref:OmpA family protein n=1 Tax=Novosphingobium sp. Leaf2 TaxID=1735670 RepID=UPI0006F8774B|nr:OmpA family protein [Novosphingobium sp. Leaf2]KQM21553.1 cell envelope biogenesis protein OmpA [Novosphingobium sp. Leaf2]
MIVSKHPKMLMAVALLAGTAGAGVSAQSQDAPPPADAAAPAPEAPPPADVTATVPGTRPVQGPEIKGIISARSGDRMQVTADDGTKTVVTIDDGTKITAVKGLFGMNRSKLASTSLLNGLPVTVKTVQGGDGLLASDITLQGKDLRTAAMIHNGTDQRFSEQTAATEALRGRMGDIDKYNVKNTINVNFDTGKAVLSPQAKADLCAAATAADGMDNALLLVVGYTDSTGTPEFNQTLSEKRAGNVVNYLQQACHWKPYRMLTPTGMSEADPLADNSTPEGKAQNRRVSVNVLVSKGLDGL